MTHNAFKLAARATKAAGILRAMNAFSAYRGSPVTAREIIKWRAESWDLVAMIARVNPPSVETRSMVIDELCRRDALVAASNERRM